MTILNFLRVDESLAVGTYLQGCIEINYFTLKRILGRPRTGGDSYKIDAEWVIQFKDGTIATIYNYKDGKNYLGKEGIPTSKINEWHVGGHNERALFLVKQLLEIK